MPSTPQPQEPDLYDVIDDPIVGLLMRRDGVQRETLVHLLEGASQQLHRSKKKF